MHRQDVNSVLEDLVVLSSNDRSRTQLSHLKDKRAETDEGVHRKDCALKSQCSAWLTAGHCYSTAVGAAVDWHIRRWIF